VDAITAAVALSGAKVATLSAAILGTSVTGVTFMVFASVLDRVDGGKFVYFLVKLSAAGLGKRRQNRSPQLWHSEILHGLR
jgi:hypothetical protein